MAHLLNITMTVEIEYCKNCQYSHPKARHDSQKYIFYFQKIKHYTLSLLKADQQVYFKERNLPKKRHLMDLALGDTPVNAVTTLNLMQYQRIGAFEVYVQNVLLFSKINTGQWPNCQNIATKIIDMLDAKRGLIQNVKPYQEQMFRNIAKSKKNQIYHQRNEGDQRYQNQMKNSILDQMIFSQNTKKKQLKFKEISARINKSLHLDSDEAEKYVLNPQQSQFLSKNKRKMIKNQEETLPKIVFPTNKGYLDHDGRKTFEKINDILQCNVVKASMKTYKKKIIKGNIFEEKYSSLQVDPLETRQKWYKQRKPEPVDENKWQKCKVRNINLQKVHLKLVNLQHPKYEEIHQKDIEIIPRTVTRQKKDRIKRQNKRLILEENKLQKIDLSIRASINNIHRKFYQIKNNKITKIKGHNEFYRIFCDEVLPKNGQYYFSLRVLYSKLNKIQLGIICQRNDKDKEDNLIGINLNDGKIYSGSACADGSLKRWREGGLAIDLNRSYEVMTVIDMDGQFIDWYVEQEIIGSARIDNQFKNRSFTAYISLYHINDVLAINQEKADQRKSLKNIEKEVIELREDEEHIINQKQDQILFANQQILVEQSLEKVQQQNQNNEEKIIILPKVIIEYDYLISPLKQTLIIKEEKQLIFEQNRKTFYINEFQEYNLKDNLMKWNASYQFKKQQFIVRLMDQNNCEIISEISQKIEGELIQKQQMAFVSKQAQKPRIEGIRWIGQYEHNVYKLTKCL